VDFERARVEPLALEPLALEALALEPLALGPLALEPLALARPAFEPLAAALDPFAEAFERFDLAVERAPEDALVLRCPLPDADLLVLAIPISPTSRTFLSSVEYPSVYAITAQTARSA
jgi:hypothetical protein